MRYSLLLSLMVIGIGSPPGRPRQEDTAADRQAKASGSGGGTPSRWEDGFSTIRDNVERAGPVELLIVESVLEELRITEDQKARLRESRRSTIEKVRKQTRKTVRELTNKQIDFMKNPEELQKVYRQGWREHTGAVSKVLDEDQYKRLWGIAIQVAGPIAITWPEVQDKLRLDPVRRGQAEAIAEEYKAGRKALQDERNALLREFRQGKGDRLTAADTPKFIRESSQRFDEFYEKDERQRDRAARALMKLLTRSQQNTLRKLQGEPFDVADLIEPGSERRQIEANRKREADASGDRSKAAGPR